MIVNRNSGKCLAVPGGNPNDGVQLIQYTCHPEYEDQWWFLYRFTP